MKTVIAVVYDDSGVSSQTERALDRETHLRLKAVFEAIIREREFQTAKYGSIIQPSMDFDACGLHHNGGWLPGPGGHELPGWLLVIRKELREAEEAATGHGKREKTGRNTVRAELVQIAATAIAALEQHGVEEK